MLEENGIFKIDIGVSHIELTQIHKDIVKNINSINTIEISQDDELKSSALLSLLKTIKNSKPEIVIPLIDEQNSSIKGLGRLFIAK